MSTYYTHRLPFSHVTRVKPTVFVNGFFCLILVVQVSLEHIRPIKANLPRDIRKVPIKMWDKIWIKRWGQWKDSHEEERESKMLICSQSRKIICWFQWSCFEIGSYANFHISTWKKTTTNRQQQKKHGDTNLAFSFFGVILHFRNIDKFNFVTRQWRTNMAWQKEIHHINGIIPGFQGLKLGKLTELWWQP